MDYNTENQMSYSNNFSDSTNQIEQQKSNLENSALQVESPDGDEEEIGEHDIVIEEDFEINLEVADVSSVSSFDVEEKQEVNTEIDIGTEQSGNITF